MGTQSTHFVLRSTRVFTGNQDTALDDGFVEVDRGRIVRVGEVAERRGDPSVPVYDYGDATIMPGMIDTHAHITLTGDGKSYEEQVLDPDEMMALIAVNNLQRHLAHGVTTLRDNGGRNRVVFTVREAIDRGYITGPRLLLSGRPVTHSLGHFYWCNGVADGLDQIRAAVRMLAAEGADHIKIMASGGATAGNSPYFSSYDAIEMRAAVETAHDLGMLTTAHARSKSSIVNAVEAGLDCLEHAEFLVPSAPVDFGHGVVKAGTMVYDPAVGEKMLAAGGFVSFTPQVSGYEELRRLRDRDKDGRLVGEQRARMSELQAFVDMKAGIFTALLGDGFSPRLTLSSDAGPQEVTFGTLHHALEFAVEVGMPVADALKAVTSVAAEACGIAGQVGTVEVGKLADLIVLPGDVMADVSVLASPLAVFQGGLLVAPFAVGAGALTRPVDFPMPTYSDSPTDWTDDC